MQYMLPTNTGWIVWIINKVAYYNNPMSQVNSTYEIIQGNSMLYSLQSWSETSSWRGLIKCANKLYWLNSNADFNSASSGQIKGPVAN